MHDVRRAPPSWLLPEASTQELLFAHHDYADWFPLARQRGRRWTLYVGPTNAGKTHAALSQLMRAKAGVYLAPLRLMALEVSETLDGAGIPCSLRTGEEHRVVPHAQHHACTIEMVDLTTPWPVAVIDEVQLMADPARGWAWTQALVGVNAEHVVLTGSPGCVPWVQALADRLGEPLTLVPLERKTPLTVAARPTAGRGLRRGDALVVFSRREALDWRSALMQQGLSVATIYGALGPEVRQAEAARFREGRADVVVATDAIGLGLNLPIQRVIFSRLDKFDGRQERPLSFDEIRQIGGRAGRFGLHAAGEVGALSDVPDGLARIARALRQVPTAQGDPQRPFVWLPWAQLQALEERVGYGSLRALLMDAYRWTAAERGWTAPDLAPLLEAAALVDRTALPLAVRFRYLGCPLDGVDGPVTEAVAGWVQRHGHGQSVPCPQLKAPTARDELGLGQEERLARILGAYVWLAQRWPGVYVQGAAAVERRAKAHAYIEHVLAAPGRGRRCAGCQRLIRGHQRQGLCSDCRRPKHRQRSMARTVWEEEE